MAKIKYNDEYHIRMREHQREYNKKNYKAPTEPKIKYNDEFHIKQREYRKEYYKKNYRTFTIYPTFGYMNIKNRWYQLLGAILKIEVNKLII
jgi:hypothetical protein